MNAILIPDPYHMDPMIWHPIWTQTNFCVAFTRILLQQDRQYAFVEWGGCVPPFTNFLHPTHLVGVERRSTPFQLTDIAAMALAHV